jgi:hypothetical protein
MEPDRWSEENVNKRRLENLAKGRETLKKKREAQLGSKLPFEVTPITTSVKATIPHVSEESEESIDENNFTTSIRPWDFSAELRNAGYSILCSFASIAVGLALKVLVDGLRDSILHPPSTPDNVRREDGNKGGFSDRDIIFSAL